MAIEALSDIIRNSTSAFNSQTGLVFKTANVNITEAVFLEKIIIVPDIDAIVNKSVIVLLSPNLDWEADDLRDFSVSAYIETEGTINIYVNRPGPIVGNLTFKYYIA